MKYLILGDNMTIIILKLQGFVMFYHARVIRRDFKKWSRRNTRFENAIGVVQEVVHKLSRKQKNEQNDGNSDQLNKV